MHRASDTTIGLFLLRSLRLTAVLVLMLFIAALSLVNLVRGDDLTGLPQDDPKDLLPAPPSHPQPVSESSGFLPLPSWSRASTMPPLPVQLKPMGTRTPGATPSTALALATPPPLAPPKDTPPASSTSTETETAGSRPAPAPTPAPTPAMVTVSPFLQWIKANPDAAAAQARQQADSYHAQPAPGPAAGPGPSDQPYWLPPLIDSADFGTAAVGGSAAIYEKPQR